MKHQSRAVLTLACAAVLVPRAALPAAGDGARAPRPPGQEPAPAATKLLADARAARAAWKDFPGFSADVEVNLDGKLSSGTVKVDARGRVSVDVPDQAGKLWAKHLLASVVGHRLDTPGSRQTPCAFADDNPRHPLGRAIHVLGDEFHSSYRIRDRQILAVNRQMEDERFSITVLENRRNDAGKFLPAFFVVNSWDAKTGALRSSQTQHQTWRRVGRFDLPETTTVVTAAADKQETRSVRLSRHRLLP